ncbi:ATP-dependent RNA helicase, putative [Plasmodium reichenowi]|uniref:ATP-dependent RNA helicase n=1 Tax=Plasmodium reichenowi TaxID=5854 RepID=A0A2P9D3H0_PLARE|nr:ATP-dependent RNA helicase, putative [Plasmodium reichenowi]
MYVSFFSLIFCFYVSFSILFITLFTKNCLCIVLKEREESYNIILKKKKRTKQNKTKYFVYNFFKKNNVHPYYKSIRILPGSPFLPYCGNVKDKKKRNIKLKHNNNNNNKYNKYNIYNKCNIYNSYDNQNVKTKNAPPYNNIKNQHDHVVSASNNHINMMSNLLKKKKKKKTTFSKKEMLNIKKKNDKLKFLNTKQKKKYIYNKTKDTHMKYLKDNKKRNSLGEDKQNILLIDKQLKDTEYKSNIEQQNQDNNHSYFEKKKKKKKKKKIHKFKRSKKQENILNMFENNLNYSIDKLNKKTKKYEIFKQKENIKSDVLQNEILKKILSKDTKSKNKDDKIKNENDKIKNENDKIKNKYDKIKNKDDKIKNKTDKRQNKIKMPINNNQNIYDITNNQNIYDISNEQNNKDLHNCHNDHQHIHNKDLNNCHNDHQHIHNKDLHNCHNDHQHIHNKDLHNCHNDHQHIHNKNIITEHTNDLHNHITTNAQVNNNQPIINIQQIFQVSKSVDNFRRQIQIKYNKQNNGNEIKKRLQQYDCIIDFNANTNIITQGVAEKEKKKINKNYTFYDVGIYDNFINIYLKYNDINYTTDHQSKYIPIILFFLNNVKNDLYNSYKQMITYHNNNMINHNSNIFSKENEKKKHFSTYNISNLCSPDQIVINKKINQRQSINGDEQKDTSCHIKNVYNNNDHNFVIENNELLTSNLLIKDNNINSKQNHDMPNKINFVKEDDDQKCGEKYHMDDQKCGEKDHMDDQKCGEKDHMDDQKCGEKDHMDDQKCGEKDHMDDQKCGEKDHMDDQKCGERDHMDDKEKTSNIKQILYVNKYNEKLKKLIRTFFLHCPTGTGKTFIYLLPVFQEISNYNFLEYEQNQIEKKECYDENNLFYKHKLFYANKNINEQLTSFLCINKTEEHVFRNYNIERMKHIFNCIINQKNQINLKTENTTNGSLKNKKEYYAFDEKKKLNDNHKNCLYNTERKKNKKDILLITYNKELAVQIYELYKDIINSFYKSYNASFFKNNNSIIYPSSIQKDGQMLIEKININYKEKLNMNVHLLIGGNNIKYQLKSLKKKNNNNNKNVNININSNIKINSNSNNNYYYDKDNHANDKMDRHNINDKHSNEQHDIQSSFYDEENINIYIGTPGRLHKLIHEKKIIKLNNISTVIFDEYDFFFNSMKVKNNLKNKEHVVELENQFFAKLLKSIYLKNKEEIVQKKKIIKDPNNIHHYKNNNSVINVICCSATSAIYPYLTYTKHIITTNFLNNLYSEFISDKYITDQNYKERKPIQNEDITKKDTFITKKKKEIVSDHNGNNNNDNNNNDNNNNDDDAIYSSSSSSGAGLHLNNQKNNNIEQTNNSFINYKKEQIMLNDLFKINNIVNMPKNLIHLNYCYDKKNKERNNNATSNFLRVLFSNPLNKNVLVFCNTKKKVLDLWSLFRNRFDVDIQTIFSQKDKGKKKIFKDINYANFFKNDLIDYKNLKKYVNFLFISTNLLYRGINCMGFTTIINYDMPFDTTEYVHRCGRIGRINNKGAIINIFEKKMKRNYNKEIFNKLNIKTYDIDCYMNNMFTLKEKVKRK